MSPAQKPDHGKDEKVTVTETRSRDYEGGGALPETRDVYDEGESGVDPVYQAKARILNDAFQELGMGKYQVRNSSIRLSLLVPKAHIQSLTCRFFSGTYLS